MVTVDLLLPGFPGRTVGYGALAWISIPLIRAGGKNILVDTGGPGVHRVLLQRLAERGLEATDIHMVLLSHSHWDHTLGVPLFPNAELVIGRGELDWALTQVPHLNPAVPTYLLKQLAKDPRLRTVDGDTEILPGLTMFDTPGHTPGLMSVLAVTEQGNVVAASDALKYRLEWISQDSDTTMDAAASSASIRRISSMADMVIPGHDRPFRIVDGKPIYTCEFKVEIVARLSPYKEDAMVLGISLPRG